MQLTKLLGLALAGQAAAQSLIEVLSSNNATSGLLSAIQLVNNTAPQVANTIAQLRNVTVLVPSNEALSAILSNNATAQALAADPGLLVAILQYHILNGVYYASNFTEQSKFIPTYLIDEKYANVTGGQVVHAQVKDEKVNFYTALGAKATVTQANLNFTGGTVHLIDSVLSIPLNESATAVAANLTSAAGALRQANLVQTVDHLRDVTIFVPSNEAFSAISSLASNLTTETLASILQYHVVVGTVAYSTTLSNTTIQTVGGGNVTIRIINNNVFVNSAKVIIPDVLVSNGVVHVIDNVLNPGNATATPNPTATAQEPAFSGASSTGVVFTSGITGPTSTAPIRTSTAGQPTTTASTAGAPMRTAAVGAAALFGGAAALLNM